VTGHRFHPSVLREYDVRGVVGQTLGEADARALGRAFGTVVRRAGGARVCLGRDGRASSAGFAAAVAEGLAAAGCDVLDVGLGPTPMLYFATHAAGADGGLMVTGSHNPPDHNGFKMMLGPHLAGGGAFFGKDIAALGPLAAAGDFAAGRGRIAPLAVFDDYVAHLAAAADLARPMTVAWDAGNGAAGAAMAALCRRLPGRHRALFAEIDGAFPNHHPDPTVEKNLADLRRAVAAERAECGFAFDGDGDRIGAVDGRGRVVWADQLMVLFARAVLAERPGAPVIADVKASDVLFDAVAAAGGRPIMWKTGHSLIKAKMKEEKAPLAGEMSGHVFFADRNAGYDDGLYAAARALGVLSRAKASLADFLDALPPVVNTPEIRFAVPAERKWAVIDEVRRRLDGRAGIAVNAIDGVRVKSAAGWWLLRASNTQEMLVARCESRSAAGLADVKDQLAGELAASGLAAPPELALGA
jgi:phosphomannomutase